MHCQNGTYAAHTNEETNAISGMTQRRRNSFGSRRRSRPLQSEMVGKSWTKLVFGLQTHYTDLKLHDSKPWRPAARNPLAATPREWFTKTRRPRNRFAFSNSVASPDPKTKSILDCRCRAGLARQTRPTAAHTYTGRQSRGERLYGSKLRCTG